MTNPGATPLQSYLSLVIGHWSLVIGHWSFRVGARPEALKLPLARVPPDVLCTLRLCGELNRMPDQDHESFVPYTRVSPKCLRRRRSCRRSAEPGAEPAHDRGGPLLWRATLPARSGHARRARIQTMAAPRGGRRRAALCA